jgi:hypothetical protein
MTKRGKSTRGGGAFTNPAARVAQAVLARYGKQVAATALCLRTPVPATVPLGQVKNIVSATRIHWRLRAAHHCPWIAGPLLTPGRCQRVARKK